MKHVEPEKCSHPMLERYGLFHAPDPARGWTDVDKPLLTPIGMFRCIQCGNTYYIRLLSLAQLAFHKVDYPFAKTDQN